MTISEILNNKHDNDIFMQGFMLGSASNKSSGENMGKIAVLNEINKNGKLLGQNSIGDYTFKCFFHVLDKNNNPFNEVRRLANYLGEPNGKVKDEGNPYGLDKPYIEMNPIFSIAKFCSVIAVILFFKDEIIAGNVQMSNGLYDQPTYRIINVDDKEAGYPYYVIQRWAKVYYDYSIDKLPNNITLHLPVDTYADYPGYWNGGVFINEGKSWGCYWNAKYREYKYDDFGNVVSITEGNEFRSQTGLYSVPMMDQYNYNLIVAISWDSYLNHIYEINKLLVEDTLYDINGDGVSDGTIVVNRLL